MCQLLGMNCNTPTDITFSFSGFAQRGGKTDQHADGWGIAFFEGRPDALPGAQDKGVRVYVDNQPAWCSPIAQLIRHYPIKSRNVIAHIRKATQGVVAIENCHPFMRELWGHYWVFAHNGNLENFRPHLHRHFQPVGDTDSESAFCWLMQELAKAHATMPPVPELTRTLRELMPWLASHGTYNMLLSNGAALWAHSSTNLHYVVRQYPFSTAHLQDEDLEVDFSRHTTPDDRVAIIATLPLTYNEQWTPIPSGQLLAFVNGAPIAA